MSELFGINISTLIELIGTLATVIALVFAIRSFNRNTQINEAIFVKDLFEGFQRDRQVILNNPVALKIQAEERGLTTDEVIRRSIGSFDINRVYLIYDLHERKLTPENRWERDKQDMRRLFANEMVVNRWQETQSIFPKDFQQFIDEHILPETK